MTSDGFGTACSWFLAAAVIGVATMGIYAQGVRNDQIDECEKSLARAQTCVLVAVPKEEGQGLDE